MEGKMCPVDLNDLLMCELPSSDEDLPDDLPGLTLGKQKSSMPEFKLRKIMSSQY